MPAAMVEPGNTISVSVTEDDIKMVEEFDEYFQSLEGSYSRAGRIKEAMELYQAVHEVTEQFDDVKSPDDMPGPDFKFMVRQALINLVDRDRERQRAE